jgi:hypothetical protein
MPRYEIIIYWSQADEAFIAEVPELPGCAADGKTYKEALATWKSSFRNGSKPPKDSVALSPRRADDSPSLKSQRPHPLNNTKDEAPARYCLCVSAACCVKSFFAGLPYRSAFLSISRSSGEK